MAKNIMYKPGDHLSVPVPAGTKSGDPVRIGGLNGVAITDRANLVAAVNADGSVNASYNAGGGNLNGHASVWFEGVANLPVTTASAPTFGAPVYFDDAAKKLTTTAGSLAVWGHVVDANPIDNGGGTFQVLVRINN